MSATIVDVQPTPVEIVLQERVTTSEFIITEIQESIVDRHVRVEIELGPFVEETRPRGRIMKRGSGRRGIVVWSNEEYDAIRDTWTNSDLMAAVTAKLAAGS